MIKLKSIEICPFYNIFRLIIDLEKIQKTALKIILGDSYISYDVACTLANLLPLEFRRTELCTNFAVKLYKSPRSGEFFTPAEKLVNTRSEHQLLVSEKKCNTKRCYNAPHSYLTRLVNQNKGKIENSRWIMNRKQLYICNAIFMLPVDNRYCAQFSVLFQDLLKHRIVVCCTSPHVFKDK